MTEIEAGLQLDARLCWLLEPNPIIAENSYHPILSTALSALGFWTTHWKTWGTRWHPIPVSTNWAAFGKAFDMLAASYDIRLDWAPREYHETSFVMLARDGHQKSCASCDTIPHAFALAACEALEKRAEEEE